MGLFSKIIKGIKNIVKGVAKVIKKTVKGVAKVVKKVAKSKIFKAILVAAAIYYTGGAALKGFGVSGTGAFGTWATNVGTVMEGTGFLSTVTKPFTMLGTALGTGAGKVSDFLNLTTESGRLGADSLLAGGGKALPTGTYYDPLNKVYMNEATGKAVTGEWWKERAANIASSQGVGPTASAAATKGGRWVEGTILGDVTRNVASSVATGYVMNALNPEEEYGQKTGLDQEGPSNLDPFTVYGSDKQPLSFDGIYSNLLYGTGDPITNGGNTNLYTQDIAPA